MGRVEPAAVVLIDHEYERWCSRMPAERSDGEYPDSGCESRKVVVVRNTGGSWLGSQVDGEHGTRAVSECWSGTESDGR